MFVFGLQMHGLEGLPQLTASMMAVMVEPKTVPSSKIVNTTSL